MLNCAMLVVLSMFFSFHVKLVRDNMTTIEWMDKKRAVEGRSNNSEVGNVY
jgi:hypothetical protein